MRIVVISLLTASIASAEIRVIDGDSFQQDGITCRLNGIDAPERGQMCGSWACGRAATRALDRMVADANVSCKAHGKDGYGRVIATCYANGRDLSVTMIDAGMAWAFDRYSIAYAANELVAREKAEGVFSNEYAPHWVYRTRKWKRTETAESAAPDGCPIKGNISANSGEKVYHMPWSPWYDKTVVNEERGERWFCNEAEAVSEGWRAIHVN